MCQLTDDGDIVLGGLELPEGNIDGDTTLTLGLQLVKNPGILEGALAELSSFLLMKLVTMFDIAKADDGGDGGVERRAESRGKWGPCSKKFANCAFLCAPPPP